MSRNEHDPLSKSEIKEAEMACMVALAGGPSRWGASPEMERFYRLCKLLPRALADLAHLRGLLERAPDEKCYWAGTGRTCLPGNECPACTWTAGRTRALEGWGK